MATTQAKYVSTVTSVRKSENPRKCCACPLQRERRPRLSVFHKCDAQKKRFGEGVSFHRHPNKSHPFVTVVSVLGQKCDSYPSPAFFGVSRLPLFDTRQISRVSSMHCSCSGGVFRSVKTFVSHPCLISLFRHWRDTRTSVWRLWK